MDRIEDASTMIAASIESWARGHDKTAMYEIELAKAHALIAIAERMDRRDGILTAEEEVERETFKRLFMNAW